MGFSLETARVNVGEFRRVNSLNPGHGLDVTGDESRALLCPQVGITGGELRPSMLSSEPPDLLLRKCGSAPLDRAVHLPC